MGETKALKPIFDKLNIDDINLSVITNTGYEQGSKMVKNIRRRRSGNESAARIDSIIQISPLETKL